MLIIHKPAIRIIYNPKNFYPWAKFKLLISKKSKLISHYGTSDHISELYLFKALNHLVKMKEFSC